MRSEVLVLAAVFLGGGTGATLRFAVGRMVQAAGVHSAGGTLAVNLIGSALIGLALGWFEARGGEVSAWRHFVVVGLLGGFTTFSAFSAEVHSLLGSGRTWTAAAYVAASVLLGLGAAAAGFAAARALF